MRLFTLYYPVWIVVAAAIFAVGYAVATGTNKKVFLFSGIGGAVAALLLGVFCVYFLPTDEKAVRKTINETKNAVVAGDVDETLEHIARELEIRDSGRRPPYEESESSFVETIGIIDPGRG